MKPGFDNPQAKECFPLTEIPRNPRHWFSCGAHSVYHALLCLGIVTDKSEAVDWTAADLKKFGIPVIWGGWWDPGLVPEQLIKLTKKHGGKPMEFSTRANGGGFGRLRRWIDSHLARGHPVIIACQNDEHWALLAGHNGDTYYWIDSASQEAAVGACDLSDIEDWVIRGSDWPDEDPPSTYYAIAVAPGKDASIERSLVPWMETLWQLLASDRELAGNWAFYLEQLDYILDYGTQRETSVPAGEFFQNYEEAIVQPVLWTDSDGDLEEKQVRDLYRSYWTVADMHSLRVPSAYQSHVACHLTLLLRDQAMEEV
jgi:hypothetical protein